MTGCISGVVFMIGTASGAYVHQPHSNFQHVVLEGEISEAGPGAGGAVGGFLGGGEEVGAGFVEGGHGLVGWLGVGDEI